MANVSVLNTTSQLSGKTICIAENDQTVSGAWTFTGNQLFNGNVTLGNAVGDTLTVTATVVSNLIFTDATYDIGASGATRPRDFFLSRNATIGGTLGVTGVITATAGQIVFPATQSAAAGVNTLDDYEEGTWTPVDNSGGSLSFTVTASNCNYIKIGRLVLISFAITWPTTADANAINITGLPFTALTTGTGVFGGSNHNTGEATATHSTVVSNTTQFEIRTFAGVAVTNATMSTDTARGTFLYLASA